MAKGLYEEPGNAQRMEAAAKQQKIDQQADMDVAKQLDAKDKRERAATLRADIAAKEAELKSVRAALVSVPSGDPRTTEAQTLLGHIDGQLGAKAPATSGDPGAGFWEQLEEKKETELRAWWERFARESVGHMEQSFCDELNITRPKMTISGVGSIGEYAKSALQSPSRPQLILSEPTDENKSGSFQVIMSRALAERISNIVVGSSANVPIDANNPFYPDAVHFAVLRVVESLVGRETYNKYWSTVYNNHSIFDGATPEAQDAVLTDGILITFEIDSLEGSQPVEFDVVLPTVLARHLMEDLTEQNPSLAAEPVSPLSEAHSPTTEPTKTNDLQIISPETATRMMNALEVHGDEFLSQQLTAEILLAAGLEPKHRFKIGKEVVWFSSSGYSIGDGRIAVVAYVQDGDKIVPRSYYRSNSQGVWRYLPGYVKNPDGTLNWYSKGHGEQSITIPIEAQQALATITADEATLLQPDQAQLIFAGTARDLVVQAEARLRGTFVMTTDRDPQKLAGNFYPTKPGQMINPEQMILSQEESPNFSSVITTWKQPSTLYGGTITIEAYPSNDGSLLFMFCKDEHNRTWIGGIDNSSLIQPTGLRRTWVYGGDLVTPALEYNTQAPGYASPLSSHATWPYADISASYTHKIPVVAAYRAHLGLDQAPLPEAQPAPAIDRMIEAFNSGREEDFAGASRDLIGIEQTVAEFKAFNEALEHPTFAEINPETGLRDTFADFDWEENPLETLQELREIRERYENMKPDQQSETLEMRQAAIKANLATVKRMAKRLGLSIDELVAVLKADEEA